MLICLSRDCNGVKEKERMVHLFRGYARCIVAERHPTLSHFKPGHTNHSDVEGSPSTKNRQVHVGLCYHHNVEMLLQQQK